MNSFERRVLVAIAIYTLFLMFACPLLCIVFFKYLLQQEAIAATMVLFMFSAMIFAIAVWMVKINDPSHKDNLARDAHDNADHTARKLLVENLYSELKKHKANYHG